MISLHASEGPARRTLAIDVCLHRCRDRGHVRPGTAPTQSRHWKSFCGQQALQDGEKNLSTGQQVPMPPHRGVLAGQAKPRLPASVASSAV